MGATVLVTGGAKRLGAAVARGCAAAGYHVVIHYGRSATEAEALATEIGGACVAGDLEDADRIDDLFARAERIAGPIDALVNSASLFEFDRPPRLDPALAARLHAINAVAPALLASALARSVAAREAEGAVVNLLDQKIANPNPDFFSYSLSKYALAGATELLAQALAPRVRVNAVSPGLTLPSGDQSTEDFDRVARKNLLERPVGAGAIADAVVWLLGARSVTGQNVFVDCGQRFLKRDRDVMFERSDG